MIFYTYIKVELKAITRVIPCLLGHPVLILNVADITLRRGCEEFILLFIINNEKLRMYLIFHLL